MIYRKIVFTIEFNRHLSVTKNAIAFLISLFDQREQIFIDLLVEIFASI